MKRTLVIRDDGLRYIIECSCGNIICANHEEAVSTIVNLGKENDITEMVAVRMWECGVCGSGYFTRNKNATELES